MTLTDRQPNGFKKSLSRGKSNCRAPPGTIATSGMVATTRVGAKSCTERTATRVRNKRKHLSRGACNAQDPVSTAQAEGRGRGKRGTGPKPCGSGHPAVLPLSARNQRYDLLLGVWHMRGCKMHSKERQANQRYDFLLGLILVRVAKKEKIVTLGSRN